MFAKPVPRILIVDDEPSVREFLTRAVRPVAADVHAADSAHAAMECIARRDFDLIISDLAMANGNGMELLTTARRSFWDMGFIMMSGCASVESAISALRLQAADFLIKPFTVAQLHESVVRSYRNLLAHREARAYHGMLESSLERRTQDLERALQSVEANYATTLEALVAALDAREHETFNHSFRVRTYTLHLARAIGYPPALLGELQNAALLHDIGKIAVTDSILLKRGNLTPEEWTVMKTHPESGERILSHVPFLRSAAKIVRHHHERWDGKGYPDRLSGEEIPLGARVFAFADTLDAMSSDRPYRKAPGFDAARREIRLCTGAQFDPHVADTFLETSVARWKELRDQAEDTHRVLIPEQPPELVLA